MLRYRIELTPDDNDTFLVTSPDIPIVTYGEDEASAIANAVDAAKVMIASFMNGREDIPVTRCSPISGGSFIQMPLQVELTVGLYQAMLAANMRPADLMRRMNCSRETVDRLLKLNHNSTTSQFDDAFKAIGLSVNVEVQPMSRSGSDHSADAYASV